MNRPEPQRRQPVVTSFVIYRIMGIAIHFNGKTDSRAKEVNNRRCFDNDMLSSELMAFKLSV